MMNYSSESGENPGTGEQTPPFYLRVFALLLLMIFVGSGGWLFWLATHHARP